MATNNPLGRLAELLATSGALPDITPERAAPSTEYDLLYRTVIVASAFQLHAKADQYSTRPRLQSRRLKLLQFVAIRPWLIDMLRNWSKKRDDAQESLEA